MELQLNAEGVWYVLGISLENPGMFSQVILNPGEVDGLPPEAKVNAFKKLEQARRVGEVLQGRYERPLSIYEVRIQRVKA